MLLVSSVVRATFKSTLLLYLVQRVLQLVPQNRFRYEMKLPLLSLLLLPVLHVLQVQMQPVESVEDNDNEAGRVLYDQRQTGKYNIHVSIKDVAIIEVDQNELADVSGKTS